MRPVSRPNQAGFCPKFYSFGLMPDFQPHFIQVAIFEPEFFRKHK